MGLISWIILGAAENIIVGIVGAFIGGLAMSLIDRVGVAGFDIRSFLVALLGSVILLAIVKAVRK